VNYGRCDPPIEVVSRARSRLGERDYDLVGMNCEHFVRWCKTGEAKSEQVKDKASTAAGVGASAALTGGGISVVSGVGAAAGLSGPGILSGLAAVGGTVGGGAVAGMAVLGAAPGLVGALAMRKVLEDDPALPTEEREARTVGRTAAAIGAAAGSGGAVLAVSSAGVAGLSGAGIASGLAAIGGTVGGGMAAGTAIVVAAPAAAAAAVGYGVYRLWKWLSG
jgi:hypothetical protein